LQTTNPEHINEQKVQLKAKRFKAYCLITFLLTNLSKVGLPLSKVSIKRLRKKAAHYSASQQATANK